MLACVLVIGVNAREGPLPSLLIFAVERNLLLLLSVQVSDRTEQE